MSTFTPDTDGDCSGEQRAAFTLPPPFCMSEVKRIIIIFFFFTNSITKGSQNKSDKDS